MTFLGLFGQQNRPTEHCWLSPVNKIIWKSPRKPNMEAGAWNLGEERKSHSFTHLHDCTRNVQIIFVLLNNAYHKTELILGKVDGKKSRYVWDRKQDKTGFVSFWFFLNQPYFAFIKQKGGDGCSVAHISNKFRVHDESRAMVRSLRKADGIEAKISSVSLILYKGELEKNISLQLLATFLLFLAWRIDF